MRHELPSPKIVDRPAPVIRSSPAVVAPSPKIVDAAPKVVNPVLNKSNAREIDTATMAAATMMEWSRIPSTDMERQKKYGDVLPAMRALQAEAEKTREQTAAMMTLAMSSTLAGNLTILGSIANLIVVQRARARYGRRRGKCRTGTWRRDHGSNVYLASRHTHVDDKDAQT